MNEPFDLRGFLDSWPYDSDNDARVVRVQDGREVLQVRTPMGIEQYELDGRPDGARPHGLESALEFQLDRLEEAKAAGEEDQFELSPDDCSELFNEGTIYYFRYVRLFQLRDWGRTVRDTTRNLKAFDLVREYAQREDDKHFLEKWRPYVVRVNASAAALMELDRRGYQKALKIIQKAVEQIEALEELPDDTFLFERDRSLTALRELSSQIQKNRPLSELERLENQLQRAIERQEFERAAQLRDRIRGLKP